MLRNLFACAAALLAAGAADAAYLAARHAVRAPLGLSGSDAALGGLVVRESARTSRPVPNPPAAVGPPLAVGPAVASIPGP